MPQTGAPILLAVVVDDIVVLVGAQVRRQCPDAVLLLSGTEMICTPCASSAGGAGLVRRALPHEQVDMVFRCIEVQQQILHIPLHPLCTPRWLLIIKIRIKFSDYQ